MLIAHRFILLGTTLLEMANYINAGTGTHYVILPLNTLPATATVLRIYPSESILAIVIMDMTG